MARTNKKALESLSYSQLREELDKILAQLQDPDCDVDVAASLYEQAIQTIGKIESHLRSAENRVEKVQADFAANTDGIVDGGNRD